MIGYLLISFSVIISYKYNYQDVKVGDLHSFPSKNIHSLNSSIYFNFMTNHSEDCKKAAENNYRHYRSDIVKKCKSGYQTIQFPRLRNYKPYILVFVLTLIRWISIGKHIWQRP